MAEASPISHNVLFICSALQLSFFYLINSPNCGLINMVQFTLVDIVFSYRYQMVKHHLIF